MSPKPMLTTLALTSLLSVTSTATLADDVWSAASDERRPASQYEIDLRGVALLGDGVPANDIIGFGLGGRYHLRDGWFVGAALENYAYDFERPIGIVGLSQDPSVKTIDADASTTVLSAHLGRLYKLSNGPFNWHWTLGLGVGFPDVKDVTGPTSTGGTFDLTTKTGTEVHLMSALGVSYDFTPMFSVAATARAEHHFIDMQVTDRTSGMTGKIDSQSPLGMHFGVAWRF